MGILPETRVEMNLPDVIEKLSIYFDLPAKSAVNELTLLTKLERELQQTKIAAAVPRVFTIRKVS